ncbi:MAG: nucleoside kinase [Ruminococcus flavefaciens]|nr:nucleoside kinase [Ruminococcus flavefaciens]
MNIEVTRINHEISENPEKYVLSANEDYIYRLQKIVSDIILHQKERPVIVLAGPSGSGKTTTALTIGKLLTESGHTTHTISMDNYFCSLTPEEKRLSALGKVDLESPLRVDKELLNFHIEKIGRGETVEIPQYNFGSSSREPVGVPFRREHGELVIFEGIHALNPEVITVPDSQICKIYVSVRTRVTCGDIILHPSKIRLMRRMIRDSKFRQRSLRETMNMFESVEQGENKYIMPYKHRSDYDVDTFVPYELSLYRDSLLESLHEMNDVPELADITEVMENLLSVESSAVPPNSMVREFIGDGEFN